MNNNMYYTNMYEQAAESLYPQIYRDLIPHVRRVCQRVDRPSNVMPNIMPNIMPNMMPNKELLDQMVEEVYDAYHTETLGRQSKESYMPEDDYYSARRNPWRNPLTDLIGIILIGELLRRRRGFYPYPTPYPTPYPYPAPSPFPYY